MGNLTLLFSIMAPWPCKPGSNVLVMVLEIPVLFLLPPLPSPSVFTVNLNVTALAIQCQHLGPPNSLSFTVYKCKTYRTCTFCVRTLFQMTVWQRKCFWVGKNRLACKCCQKHWIFLEGRHFGYFSWQKIIEGYFSKYKFLSLWKRLSSLEKWGVYSRNTGTQPPDAAKVGIVFKSKLSFVF